MEQSYSYNISGSKSSGQRCLEATAWEISSEEYLANNNNKWEAINLSTVLSGENLLLDEREKKLHKVTIAEAELEQLCVMVLFVIITCNTNFSLLLNLYLIF